MEIVYETKRLCLCVFDNSHLESVMAFWGNDEVMALCDGASPQDLVLKTIKGYKKCHETNGLSVYAVKDKDSNEVIGAAGFNITDSLANVELIYHFSKKFWGKGFATEAVNACLDMAKKLGEVQIITASASPENSWSIKILEKIGFTFKGMKWFEDTEQEEPYYEYKL